MRPSVFSALLLVTPAAAQSPELTLEIRPAKAQLLTGEPLLIIGRATSTTGARLEAPPGLHILVGREGALRRMAPSFAVATLSGGGATVGPNGLAFEVDVVFDSWAAGGRGDWAFPEPGEYRVALEQREPGGSTVRSNTIAVSVVAPTGQEAMIFAEIEAHPDLRRWLAYQDLGGSPPEPFRTLVDAHPASRYLRRGLYRELENQVLDAQRGCDPSRAELCIVPRETLPAAIRLQSARLCPHALALSSVADEWSAKVLRLLAKLQRDSGDPRAEGTIRHLARDFGDRVAGQWAREELEP